MPDSSELGPGFILELSGYTDTAGTPKTNLLKASTHGESLCSRVAARDRLSER